MNQSVPTAGARPRAAHRLALVGAALSLFAAAPTISGCDATATIFKLRVQLNTVQATGAWPARQLDDGGWERVCTPGAEFDGLLTDVALISSTRQSSTDADSDRERDLQIQPDDIVEFLRVDGPSTDDIRLSGTTNMRVEFDCIDPQPGDSQCSGAEPSFPTDTVQYHANTADRRAGHNVLVLIDQSGSIGGLVDPELDNRETGRTFTPPTNFGQLASDRQNLRLSAVKTLMGLLDTEDAFGAIAFNEADNLWVPCDLATGDLDTDMEACYGARNMSIWESQTSGIDSLGADSSGRSNLWSAVEYAYEFLADRNERQRTNHVVVITDGPDTCSRSEHLNDCESTCSTTAYRDVLERITDDMNDPNATRVRVHFVQFESLGYPGRDPRQWEAACASGGHYQYINTNSFPREQSGPAESAFGRAINNLRSMLQGHWEIAAEIPAFVDDNTGSGTPPGSLYALSGAVTLRAAANLTGNDVVVPIGIGQGQGAGQATQWDRRLTTRKACVAPTDCGAAPDAGSACTIICSDESHVCPGGATGTQAPDTAACTVDGGGGGFCCEGTCEPVGGTCAACTE